jgi:hypothetical protein
MVTDPHAAGPEMTPHAVPGRLVTEPRWCPDHGRLECVKPAKRAAICHGAVVRGESACRMHLGRRVADAKHDRLARWAAQPDGTGISPYDAAHAMLETAWRRARIYAAELQRQAEGDGDSSIRNAGDGGLPGLVGHTYSSGGPDIGIYATGEQARALVTLEGQERDRVMRFAKMCHEMGIEERAQWVAERDAAGIAAVVRGVLLRFGLDAMLPEVGSVVAGTIRELTGAPDGDTP